MPSYDDVVASVDQTGMIVRGGFVVDADESIDARSIVMIGNAGAGMWQRFSGERLGGANPLDDWTRAKLKPIADEFGATFVHPSDQPFQPFQRWAQRAEAVWQSPIGLMIDAQHGLWHAYRGAFLFDRVVEGIPTREQGVSPCVTCEGKPCLTTCPVDAFTIDGYDASSCRGHVRSGTEPGCSEIGCVARRACPVGVASMYESEQMQFHMVAFVGATESAE